MRMRGKKAIFNYKDTWNLDDILKPIIGAGIAKYIEVVKSKPEFSRVPNSIFSNYNIEDDQKALEIWNEILEKINYAFNQPQPNYDDYGFEYNAITTTPIHDDEFGEVYQMNPITVTNKKEHKRFIEDSDDWEKRCQEGYELFGKYFRNLWW